MESRAAIEARARPAWERVVGLIGYFDLDPNRALDVILDVFSAHLATHHSFFVSFLSFSPWAPRSKPVNSPDSDEAMAVDPDPPKYRGKTLDDVLSLAEDLSGKSAEDPQLPGPAHGNPSRVLAQVLGFKFAHYQVCRDILLLFAKADFKEAFRGHGTGTDELISYGCHPDPRRLYLIGRALSSRKCEFSHALSEPWLNLTHL